LRTELGTDEEIEGYIGKRPLGRPSVKGSLQWNGYERWET